MEHFEYCFHFLHSAVYMGKSSCILFSTIQYLFFLAFALKRGLLTAKAGRPDINRSGNLILRMGLDGRLCLALRPPGFTKNRGEIFKLGVWIP